MSLMENVELDLSTFTTLLEADVPSAECRWLVEELSQCNYCAVLRNEKLQPFLQVHDGVNWLSDLSSHISAYLTQGEGECLQMRELNVLGAAVAGLQIFVQNNYVGPPAKVDSLLQNRELRDQALSELAVDGEAVYHLAQSVEMLALAKIILVDCRQYLQYCQAAKWWALRCIYLHQALLQERSPTLKDLAMVLISEVKQMPAMCEQRYSDAQVQFHLEAGHLLYFYYEAERAAECFVVAQKLTGLNVQLTGALGKRTRFQQKDITQLMLQVTRDTDTSPAAEDDGEQQQIAVKATCMPKNVALDDDTVLESIQLTEDNKLFITNLSATEQAMILGLLYHHRKVHEGYGDIIREETMAFVNSVLQEPQSWCVQTQALYKRTQMEQDSTRRMQRSLTQLEELVAQFSKEEPPVSDRISHVYCSQMPMLCQIQKESAKLLSNIGAMSSALEIYLQLEMWEDVIKCYSSLGRREKAENVIREQLAIQETPALYCYLGDVTDDPQYYTQAWELSHGRFSRAQRCLAFYYLRKCEFETSLEHFAKTLELNKLQVGVWFSYGCAAMACEKYELAAAAFRRCVSLETDNFEAWSNLATAYVRSNQKPRAFTALKEALKCEYENWRLWENYLIVGTDLGEFEEVLKAYHRLLDIKDKYTEADVLKILVRAVNENLPDVRNKPSRDLRPKLQELFGRITSKVTTSADVWRLYAELIHGDVTAQNDVKQRGLQYLQKAHRCSTQTLGWEKDPTKCKDVAKESAALGKVYVDVAEKESDTARAVQVLSAGKLMLRGVLTKIQKQYRDPVTDELPAGMTEVCTELSDVLEQIERTIQHRKTAS